MPSIAVILAAYNGSIWIQEQIASIFAQKDVDVTLFVSVDVSADGTEALVERMAAVDGRIVVLPHGQRFGGAAPNFYRLVRDVDFAAFDYVALADQDDIWLMDKLSRACSVLAAAGADAYSSNATAFWPDGRQMLIRKSQPQVKWDFLFEAAGPGCTYVLSRKLALEIQHHLMSKWDEAQTIGLHDWLFYAYARANGYRWVIDDFSGIRYRQHAHNQVGVNAGLKAFLHRFTKIANGWGFTQAAKIAHMAGVADDPFVSRWANGSRTGLLYLGLHFYQCRRRFRDQVFFLLSCVLLSVLGKRRQ
ncbi:glycosyltransferase [Methylotenera sp. G11]|uniref:glycosyltransferase n=1 Tax=Methylotenera sp. G11 TaxID=1506585 RepID=UPI0006461611|nr:glycosyltransferase [Methylotenera sp. G11]